MNKCEYRQIRKQFDEMIIGGKMPLFEFEINHSDYNCMLFSIALYNDFVFLGFDTDIVNEIRPSGSATVCGLGVEYKVKDIEADTVDKLIEFLYEESQQFILDSNLLP